MNWLLTGLQEGFHIGFTGTRPDGRPRNLPTSNFEKLEIVRWLKKGYTQGYILGPFDEAQNLFPNVVISPVGAVPKPPNKCRMIHHLSADQGGNTLSVNDVIQERMKTVTYLTTKEVVAIADAVGKGGVLWTVDAQDAYVRVPVHRSEWTLLGIKFHGKVFIMTCLPFGLASSCKIYNEFADGVEWLVVSNDPDSCTIEVDGARLQLVRHYLDDFVGGHWDQDKAYKQYHSLIKWLEDLQIPTQPRKCAKPATRQKILGSMYDTVTRCISLPKDKAEAYLADIDWFVNTDTKKRRKRKFTKQQLQSLGGKLRFAARHVWCGASFCRRLEWQYARLKHGGHHTRLSRGVFEDLLWWKEVLKDIASGISFDYILRPRQLCSWTIWTDACLDDHVAGFGGLSSDGRWFQFRTPVAAFGRKKPDINWCELAAVVVALRLWAPQHTLESVHLWCDNMSTCSWLAKQGTDEKRPDVFVLVRMAARFSIRHRFHYWIDHIAGEDNDPADALSRFYADPFSGVERLQKHLLEKMRPRADPSAPLLQELIELYREHVEY